MTGWLSEIIAQEPMIRGGAFLGTLAVILLWEHRAPAREFLTKRSRRLTVNLGLGVFNMILLRLIMPLLALEAALYAHLHQTGAFHFVSLPLALHIFLTVVILDGLIYGQHALLHKIPLLWRLHATHHSDPDFDASTALRFHPFEILLSMGIKIGAVILLGASPHGVILFEILLSSMSIFNHANAALPDPCEKYVRAIFVTPSMHRTHHSVREGERDSNFGFVLSVWDRLFGTYTPSPKPRLVLGLSSCARGDTMRPLWIMALPWRGDLLFGEGEARGR